jgi:hypothetical protein
MPAPSRARLRTGVLVACLLGGPVAAGSPGAMDTVLADAGNAPRRHVVFSITSPLITESSSLEVSTVHPGLVYTANDSGGSATVYALDASDGALVGETSLTGVTAVDIEAMAIGADGTLVVGDIGDNTGDRNSVALYRLAQPGRGNSSVQPVRVALTYRGGPRDAESLLYESRTGRVYVVSKLLGGAKVYRSPPDVFSHRHATLVPVASAPPLATDATFLDGYRYALVRSYFSAVVYRFPSWQRVEDFDLPLQPQGESVAALPGDKTVLIGSEGKRSKVLRFRLPVLGPTRHRGHGAATTVTVNRPQSATPTSRHREYLRSVAGVVVAVAAAGVALVLLVGLVRHRRHRLPPRG